MMDGHYMTLSCLAKLSSPTHQICITKSTEVGPTCRPGAPNPWIERIDLDSSNEELPDRSSRSCQGEGSANESFKCFVGLERSMKNQPFSLDKIVKLLKLVW